MHFKRDTSSEFDFFFFLFLELKTVSSIKNNTEEWFPSKLIEKFQNKTLVDTNNHLDISKYKIEYSQFNNHLNNLEDFGYKVNIYVVDFIPEIYSYKFLFYKSKNTEKFLMEIMEILHEQYNQEKEISIIAVFAVNEKILDFYKEENFLLGTNSNNKKVIINLAINKYNDNKENYTLKSLNRFLYKLNEYYTSPFLNCEIKLNIFFIISAVFYKLYDLLKTYYIIPQNIEEIGIEIFNLSTIYANENYRDPNRFLSENLFCSNSNQIANFHRNPNHNLNNNNTDAVLINYNWNQINNDANYIPPIFDNVNNNFQSNQNNYNLKPLFFIDNQINTKSYLRNIDKIRNLLKNTKMNRQKYLQNICVICLEPFKNNKLKFNTMYENVEDNIDLFTIENNHIQSFKEINYLKNEKNEHLKKDQRFINLHNKNRSCIKKPDLKMLYDKSRRSLNKLLIKTEENPLNKMKKDGKLYLIIQFILKSL